MIFFRGKIKMAPSKVNQGTEAPVDANEGNKKA
jgi:hypothetical protein